MGTKANVLVGVAAVTIDSVPVGYTVDGVTMTIRTELADIKVEELVGTINRTMTDQEVEVTMNLAEGTLANLAAAIPGSTLQSSVLTLGGGTLQDVEIIITGTKPGGGDRVITLNNCNPTGEVGIPFKKGEISVIPVTFKALVADDGTFGDIDDS